MKKVIMKTKMQYLILLVLIGFTGISNLQAQNITVNIQNLKTSKGEIILKVFQNQQDFEQQKPFKSFVFQKENIAEGKLTLQCSLPVNGTYGIVLLDDKNSNGKMDKNFIGMPKEGIGFSNCELSKMRKPDFEEFKFDISNEPATVTIKIKYM